MIGLAGLFGGGKENAVLGSIPGFLMGQSPETIARNQLLIGGAGLGAGMLGGAGAGGMSGPEMQAFQQIRELGKQSSPMMQFSGQAPMMPSAAGMPNLTAPSTPVSSPYGTQPSTANPPPAWFPTMEGMPNLTRSVSPTKVDPMAMASLAGMLMGGGDEEQRPRIGMAPGAGTPMMRPMSAAPVMSLGELLRRG